MALRPVSARTFMRSEETVPTGDLAHCNRPCGFPLPALSQPQLTLSLSLCRSYAPAKFQIVQERPVWGGGR